MHGRNCDGGDGVVEGATDFGTRDRWFLLLLGAIYMINFIDRTIIAVVGESIRRDLRLSDLQLGMLGGLAFSLFYAVLGIPLARLAERYSRVRIIAGVTMLWSLMTALSEQREAMSSCCSVAWAWVWERQGSRRRSCP